MLYTNLLWLRSKATASTCGWSRSWQRTRSWASCSPSEIGSRSHPCLNCKNGFPSSQIGQSIKRIHFIAMANIGKHANDFLVATKVEHSNLIHIIGLVTASIIYSWISSLRGRIGASMWALDIPWPRDQKCDFNIMTTVKCWPRSLRLFGRRLV